MKDESFNQPQPTEPDPGLGWISLQKVRELYPHLPDHKLKYWRNKGKVRSWKLSKTTIINVESDIHAQVEYESRPKKRVRMQYVQKQLAKIDTGIALMVLALGLAFATYKPWEKKPTYSIWDFYFPILVILFFAVVYWIVKFIGYLRRRFFRKGKE